MLVGTNMVTYHLPGLFEFYEFYKIFLPLYAEHRDYFYDWCDIGSIYGAPSDCIWGGGRIENGQSSVSNVLKLTQEYGISARLTFSNSLLKKEHLDDKRCNRICEGFSVYNTVQNGVIVHSDLLSDYLKNQYPDLYQVSSTTKVITDFPQFEQELRKENFRYVVPDFRLNKEFENLEKLPGELKKKVEFLCNECCFWACNARKACYEAVSRKNLGEDCEHHCVSPDAGSGYSFSKAMANPGFISASQIKNIYYPMGFTNFKIEGRGLGSALILEFILYYMTRPDYQIHVREKIYLDNMLDLF